AILLAAFWGWAFIGVFDAVGYLMNGRVEQGLGRLLLFAVVGLPIAFVVSVVFVGPTLRKMMQQPIGFARAAIWGAGVSAGIAVFSIVLGRFNGLLMSLDDSRSAQIGGGNYIRSIDGILTPYGWQVVGQNSLGFIAWCTLGAMLIRLAVGPGRVDAP
ncbi:MAG: hypothetical protein AAFO72_14110, partial [Pseudomonadota bacterium]